MKTRQLTEDCRPIVEECKGCNKVFNVDGVDYCLAYPDPAIFWRKVEESAFRKSCTLASHTKIEAVNVRRGRIGQQKQRKNK